MADFEDLRGLTDDNDDDQQGEFSFDDIASDGEIDFEYGEEIGVEEEPEESGPLNKLLSSVTAQQRMFLSILVFVNALVFSVVMLMISGRIG